MDKKPANLRVYPNKIWNKVNLNLLTKSIAELMHEDIAKPEIIGCDEDGLIHFKLIGDNPQVYYSFSAYPRLLEYYHIEKKTLQRWENGKKKKNIDVPEFFMEFQHSFGIDSFTLANYMEELLSTLYADAHILTRKMYNEYDENNNNYQDIEHRMEGHPWIIANKGRIGFDGTDYFNYAPESDKLTKLFWFAAHKKRAKSHILKSMDLKEFYLQELGPGIFKMFRQKLIDMQLNPENYFFLPVHPWQINNKIMIQFQPDLSKMYLVILGQSEDNYAPQQSIRTFYNLSNPAKCYVKTAISILNTGNIRGLSPTQMDSAPKVTEWIKGLIEKDTYFKDKGTVFLGEVATISYRHPQYNSLSECPYHYKEMLGALWRESAEIYRKPGESLMTMASLLYIDKNDRPYLKALIDKSGKSVHNWVETYLEAYLQPLLHIYYQYSLCVTPHGENIIMIMKDGIPTRIIIKDFVDDIVLTEEAKETLPTEINDVLIQSSNKENVPLFILIGVFDAFFRYLSDILHTYMNYNEYKFWESVKVCIEAYQKEHPHLKHRFDKYNLFAPEFKKFYINSAKLLKNSYTQSAGFTIPNKGGSRQNPIYMINKESNNKPEKIK